MHTTMSAFRKMAFVLATTAGLVGLSAQAHPDDGFVVPVDQAAILSVVEMPSAVIVGNPTVADVSVQRGKLIVTGKTYGSTNLIILDEKGRTISEMPLTVVGPDVSRVTVYKAGRRTSYSCAPRCEAELMVGDDPATFDTTAQQIGAKTGIAAGNSR